ncbi:uncharacterized protein LOC106083167 isoform X1 [Stomoxys calcitrans]|uniref:uncharacterized protein LOC106083167 isoform X1 n=2 Tax=Stomoxys calcitrans TaxID=35570 RepID=UPI0027E2C32E|nr:uncharacterized protein LOC106083167 isoform X1 [Stomoxys calcitrans]
MWAKSEAYKNNYLQTELMHITPTTINEIVNKEVENRDGALSTVSNYMPSNCFYNRSPLAYGLWALPELMKQIGSDDFELQYKALSSLAEYVVNPLHAQRAIRQFQVVRRCQNIFFRIRMKYEKSKFQTAERILEIFYNVAKHMSGVEAIVHSNRLMDQFYAIVRDREENMLKISKILSLLTERISAAIYLLDNYNVMQKFADIWRQDICAPYYPIDLWLHFQHILQQAPDKAIELGLFEILHTRIRGRVFKFHRCDLKCFALLLRCEEGQKRFLNVDGVREMYELLVDPSKQLDSYENVILTLMNGVLAKPVLWRCREFTNLPIIITGLAEISKEYNMQLYCLQLLRELGEMPCIKRFIQENCLNTLNNISCIGAMNEKLREELLYWLQREIYHTSELKKK